MRKRPIARKLFLVLCSMVAVAILFGVHEIHNARTRRAACYRDNAEKLKVLEPSPATIDTEVQEIQQDQDVIDQIGETDDETVIHRRDRMIDGVKLKLTKVNHDRAENQRRTDQIQTELASCLAEVK